MPTLINNGDSETRKESTASNAGNGGGGNGKQHARKASKVCQFYAIFYYCFFVILYQA